MGMTFCIDHSVCLDLFYFNFVFSFVAIMGLVGL